MVSKVLQDVLDRVSTWPEERQDAAARLLLDLEAQEELEARDARGYGLSDEQVAEVKRRLDAPTRQFVTLEEMRKHFSQPRG